MGLVARLDAGMVRGASALVFGCVLPLICVVCDRSIARGSAIMDYHGERLIAWPTWMSPLGVVALPLLGWSVLRGPRGDAKSAALGGIAAVVCVATVTCWIAKLPDSLIAIVCCGFGLLPLAGAWIAGRHAWTCLVSAAEALGGPRTARLAVRGAGLVILPALLAGWALWSAEFRAAAIISGLEPGDRIAAKARLRSLYKTWPHMGFDGTWAAYRAAQAAGADARQIDHAIMEFHRAWWTSR